MPWFWTDDLARLLTGSGVAESQVESWIRRPLAIRANGEPLAVAESLLSAEEDEPALAA